MPLHQLRRMVLRVTSVNADSHAICSLSVTTLVCLLACLVACTPVSFTCRSS